MQGAESILTKPVTLADLASSGSMMKQEMAKEVNQKPQSNLHVTTVKKTGSRQGDTPVLWMMTPFSLRTMTTVEVVVAVEEKDGEERIHMNRSHFWTF